MVIFLCCINLLAADPEIHLFIHACTKGNWNVILKRQLGRIRSSGLYDACNSISLGVLGSGDITPFLQQYPKLQILFIDSDTSLYERPTLISLRDRALKNPNCVCLYIHTKGITKPKNPHVLHWVEYLEYFVIDKWRDCVASLEDNDVCGVNWLLHPKPHFSGNFWWAKGGYIITLPDHINIQNLKNQTFETSKYLASEMWIGQNSPKVKCFHQSNINHYFQSYPPSRYR